MKVLAVAPFGAKPRRALASPFGQRGPFGHILRPQKSPTAKDKKAGPGGQEKDIRAILKKLV